MKTAIIYASMTGHSKKIAYAMGKSINVTPQNIKENTAVPQADLLFIVSGIYASQPMPELVNYVKKISPEQVKKVCLLTSSASGEQKQVQLREILEQNGISVLEKEFTCIGGFLFMHMGHPNKSEIASAAAFAKGIIADE